MEQTLSEDHEACLGKITSERIFASPMHSPEPSSRAPHCKGAHRRKNKHHQLFWKPAVQIWPLNQAHTAPSQRAIWNNRRWNCFLPFSPSWDWSVCMEESSQPFFKWSFWLNYILKPLIEEFKKLFRCCKSVLCDFTTGLWNCLV